MLKKKVKNETRLRINIESVTENPRSCKSAKNLNPAEIDIETEMAK